MIISLAGIDYSEQKDSFLITGQNKSSRSSQRSSSPWKTPRKNGLNNKQTEKQSQKETTEEGNGNIISISKQNISTRDIIKKSKENKKLTQKITYPYGRAITEKILPQKVPYRWNEIVSFANFILIYPFFYFYFLQNN